MKDFLFPTPVVVTGSIEKDRPVNLTGMIGIRLQIPGRVLMCPRKQVKVHGPFRLSEKGAVNPQGIDDHPDGFLGCCQDGADLPERVRGKIPKRVHPLPCRDNKITRDRARATVCYLKRTDAPDEEIQWSRLAREGKGHSLPALFARLRQYPVDVKPFLPSTPKTTQDGVAKPQDSRYTGCQPRRVSG